MFSDIPGEKYFSAMEPLTVLDKIGIEKTAEEKKDVDKQIIEVVKTIKPNKDKEIYCHVTALGAGEWFGANNNHDHFPASDLFADRQDYGFKTFLKGGVYPLHKNKNYDKRLGNVIFSIVNPIMKRVELILRSDRDRVKEFGPHDLWDKLQDGEFIGVSMGARLKYDVCFTGDTLVRTTNGYKSIKDINLDDYVRTHKGRNRKVTTLFKRKSEQLLQIKAAGLPDVKVTQNHPFLVIEEKILRDCQGSSSGLKRRHILDKNLNCTHCFKQINQEPIWKNAEDLKIGDYVLSPVDKTINKENVDLNFAKMVGYYVGDGSLIKNDKKAPVGVAISSSSKNLEHINNVLEVLANLTTKNFPRKYVDQKKNAVSIVLHDRVLAERLKIHSNEYSDKKFFSEEVFSFSEEEKLSVIGGWIDTDGVADVKKGIIRICSINRGLILDGLRLLQSLGVPAIAYCAGKVKHFSDPKIYTGKLCWALRISSKYTKKFEAYSAKAKKLQNIKNIANKTLFFGDYIASPIREIKKLEGDLVYNLGVEEDESYIAEGYAVHNCSICGNKAKTRSDYCSDMRNNAGKILPDGRKVFVYNPRPNFFDISFVNNPADKSARVIGHLIEDDNQRCIGKICVIDFGAGDKKMNKTAEITQIQNFETIPLQQFTPQLEQQFQPEQVAEQPKVEIKKKKEIRVVKHIKYRGLSISIETISGDFRIGYNRGGKWKKRYLVHYGFIPKTEGNDGEDVDVYLKPGANKNADVYVVHQMKNKDGIRSFDEDKIMLGFDSLYEARSVYLQHMPEKYFGGIKKLSFDEFISEYLEPLKKEAEEIIKKAFCNCENTCCTKEAENKNADIVKRIPAMMQKLPNELFSKIKLKSSLQ